MKFYQKYYTGAYEELLAYYPNFLRRVLEIQAILKASGTAIDDIEEKIELLYNNSFILTSDEKTVEEWEHLLNIRYVTPLAQLSLEQRKRVIISHIIGYGHIGAPEIREIVRQYTPEAVRVDLNGGRVDIEVDDVIFDMNNLYSAIKNRMPAHLGMFLTSIKTVQMELCKVPVFSGLGNAYADSPLSNIELDYRFRSAHLIVSVQTSHTRDALPVIEPDYDFRTIQHLRYGLYGGYSANDVPAIEPNLLFHSEQGTAACSYGSVMETPINGLYKTEKRS